MTSPALLHGGLEEKPLGHDGTNTRWQIRGIVDSGGSCSESPNVAIATGVPTGTSRTRARCGASIKSGLQELTTINAVRRVLKPVITVRGRCNKKNNRTELTELDEETEWEKGWQIASFL